MTTKSTKATKDDENGCEDLFVLFVSFVVELDFMVVAFGCAVVAAGGTRRLTKVHFE